MRRVPMLWLSLTAVLLLAMILVACETGRPGDTAATPPEQAAETEAAAMPEEEEGHSEDEAHAEDEEPHEDEEEHAEGEEHAHLEVPDEYAGLINPLAGDPEAIAAGRELFLASCATCHGETGMGDGPAAVGLSPPRASSGDAGLLADMSDGYIYWRISEGGVGDPFNSAMPAWGSAFSEQQIWQLVSFLRTLPGE